jgi:hypothetical protein
MCPAGSSWALDAGIQLDFVDDQIFLHMQDSQQAASRSYNGHEVPQGLCFRGSSFQEVG